MESTNCFPTASTAEGSKEGDDAFGRQDTIKPVATNDSRTARRRPWHRGVATRSITSKGNVVDGVCINWPNKRKSYSLRSLSPEIAARRWHVQSVSITFVQIESAQCNLADSSQLSTEGTETGK